MSIFIGSTLIQTQLVYGYAPGKVKKMTTTQPSQVIVKEVVLNGSWKAAQPVGNVRVNTEGGRTMVSVDCINGQPVEFVLTRN